MCLDNEAVGVIGSATDEIGEDEFLLFLNELKKFDDNEASKRALAFASRLVETAAFDMARSNTSADVGHLIELAAFLSEASLRRTNGPKPVRRRALRFRYN